jgi:molybdopterin-containing oxidoreductase family iron-sulfur binding subunit
VVACQVENNVMINTEEAYLQHRAMTWIRIERYWEQPADEEHIEEAKARYLPVLCQHCTNAPCEPVCPVYATYHNPEGLNIQIFNRCVGTRYCANNCPYHVRFFNYWEARWPESLRNSLNPDVTIRTKGIMEKCTFCVHRIRQVQLQATREGRSITDGELQPACAQTCPTSTLVFGDLDDPNSRASRLAQNPRNYRLLEELGTEPGVVYLKKVETDAAS